MQLLLFIGIQATGKSTFYQQRFFNSHVRVSMDLLNTRNKERQFMNTCFQTHTQFVVDNTNPTRAERQKYIHQAQENGYEIIGYYFSSSIKQALQRNALRTGKARIPDIGIKGCFASLQLPKMEEGFDELYFVTTANNEFVIDNWNDEI